MLLLKILRNVIMNFQVINYKFDRNPSKDVVLLILPTILRNWSSHQLEAKRSLLRYWAQLLMRSSIYIIDNVNDATNY